MVPAAADEPEGTMQVLRDAYYFLQENGYINFGVLKGKVWVWQLLKVCP